MFHAVMPATRKPPAERVASSPAVDERRLPGSGAAAVEQHGGARRSPRCLRNLLAVARYTPHRSQQPLLEVTFFYHEETHGACAHQARELLVVEDRVVPVESAKRNDGLVGVQDYGAGYARAYGGHQVLGVVLVGP